MSAYRIAGVPFRVEGDAEAVAAFRDALAAFAAPPATVLAPADPTERVLRLRAMRERPPARGPARAEARGDGIVLAGGGMEGEVGPQGGELSIPASRWGVLRAARVFVSAELPARRRGVLLHGAAVAVAGSRGGGGPRAAVLIGASGAGKSTLAALCRDVLHADVLSDEVAAVTHEPEGWTAWGNPFWSTLGPGGAPLQARLAAVIAIEHAPSVRVERLSGARAAAALLRNAFILDPRPEVAARALAVAAELGEAVPAWRLGFTVSADAARAVGTLLGAAPRDGAGPPRAQEPAC